LVVQPVEDKDAVGGQVLAASHKQAQLGDQSLIAVQDRQVPAHPGVVGDDQRVLGVGLARAAVPDGCAVD
jgi:hypothetical protein